MDWYRRLAIWYRALRRATKSLSIRFLLKGLSNGRLTNYGRNVAQLSLHFGRCPEFVSVKEINRYRTIVAVTTTVRNVANHPKKRLKDLAVTQKIAISNRRLKSMDNGGFKRI